MRGTRRPFRLAVAASVAGHLVLVGAVVLCGRLARETPAASKPALDTRVGDDSPLVVHVAELDVAARPPDLVARASRPAVEDQPGLGSPGHKKEVPSSPTGSRPEVPSPPRTLPADILARIRQFQPAGPVQPAGGTDTPSAPTPGGGPPVHGALTPGQAVVYVLDASGSMGQGGRFDRARRSILATLRRQPPEVKFQVIVYAGSARTLLPGGCVPATAANVEHAAALLAAVEPLGRSEHADALRLAGRLAPTFVLVLTDADDLPADAVRTLTRAAKPATVCVSVVGEDGVTSPKMLGR